MRKAPQIQMIFLWVAGTAAGQIAVTSKVADFAPERTSATVLTYGTGCSASTPCNVRFNQTVYSFTAGGTVDLSGASQRGTAFAYITPAGKLTIGSNLSIKCSNCSAVAGVTGFPPNAIPLWSWTALSSAGAWDPAGGVDRRSFLSTKVINAGLGIVVTESPGETQLAVDTAAIQPILQSTPPSSSAKCNPGTIWSDSTYIYVCVAPGTIKRAALSTF